MEYLRNEIPETMTIARRLIILLAVPLAVFVGTAIYAQLEMSKIEQRSQFVADSQVPSISTIGDLSRNFTEMRVHVRSFLLATNEAGQALSRAAFNHCAAENDQWEKNYADTMISDEKDR